MKNLFGFNKAKNVKVQTEELRTFITAVQAGQKGNDYNDIRSEFNVRVVGALIGSEFVEVSKGVLTNTGNWGKLPNTDEAFDILILADEFIQTVELKYLSSIDDDMVIVNPLGRYIPYVEKITNSKFKELIEGNMRKRLSKEDFMMIGKLAGELRKHNCWVVGGWAAGLTLAIMIGAGVYVYKNGNKEKVEEIEVVEEDYDDVGSDIIISVDDDMPIVIISDDGMGIRVV